MKRRAERQHMKKRKLRKFSVFLIIAVLLMVGFGGHYAFKTYQAASQSFDDLGRDKSAKREEAVSISKDPISILLMGVDDTEEMENGRTDTLIVATFNPTDERLKLLSIPRDSLVDIAGRETQDKINHAHAYGGKAMTIETIENFLDIPIDHYAAVDFDAFVNIIDILDGINVEVPFDFEQKTIAPNSKMVQFHEGPMELDGEAALAFARMRKMDPRGDIGRNERQQEVIKAIADKAMRFGSVTKIDDLAAEIGTNMETDLRIKDGLSFYKTYSDFGSGNIDQLKLETESQIINGISYEIINEESLAEVQNSLRQHLELKDTNDINEYADQENIE